MPFLTVERAALAVVLMGFVIAGCGDSRDVDSPPVVPSGGAPSTTPAAGDPSSDSIAALSAKAETKTMRPELLVQIGRIRNGSSVPSQTVEHAAMLIARSGSAPAGAARRQRDLVHLLHFVVGLTE